MTEYDRFVKHRGAYLVMGDLDKPFHRPECECDRCEAWRADKGRPRLKELRDMDKKE